jgi:hypothetical protein
VIPANRQRNYLQSALYVIIAGICAAVLVERLLVYAEQAEKYAMEATLKRLHSALYTRVAFLVLRNEHAAIESLPGGNPFTATHSSAENYLGEFDGVPASVETGRWLYDRSRKELVYVPNLRRHLQMDGSETRPIALRFKLGVLKSSPATYSGVTLLPVEEYRWEPEP